jgi:hypothetical protein
MRLIRANEVEIYHVRQELEYTRQELDITDQYVRCSYLNAVRVVLHDSENANGSFPPDIAWNRTESAQPPAEH